MVVYFDTYEKIVVEIFRIKFSVFYDINLRSGNRPNSFKDRSPYTHNLNATLGSIQSISWHEICYQTLKQPNRLQKYSADFIGMIWHDRKTSHGYYELSSAVQVGHG